ncbi:uncharacterized protein PFLUO_LOCUS4503 [Penicillium psychrofluorescens]|uniref:uncharacterized protein n=1 Tax=Penicillium psychrofluorescens TaxID=3158075 RepID=UPI003CCDBEDA
MGKPRMIILIRHAQSEGNKNREIHQTIPDHRVKLTPEGHRQAQEAGRRLRDLLRPDDTLHFFTSPYRRTRETTEGILESLTSDSPSPSPFPRHAINVYEEPRLREQDFGNFQPCSTEMERMWLERADYGHFFYRIANGESAADAYDRVSGFNESLWRLFGEQDFASVCVLVTHGLMARVFMMKWYHWSVEYFEDLRNINHCEFVIMTHDPESGKYALQNKLRTWSDLRQERDRERETKEVVSSPITLTDPTPIRRKWGGCPDGCTHMSADVQRSLRTNLVGSVRHENGHPRHKHVDGHVQSTGHSRSHIHHETASADRTSAAPMASESASKPSNPVGDVLPDWNDLPPRNPPDADRHANSKPRLTVEAGDAQNDPRIRDSSSDSRPTAAASHPKRPTLHGLNRDSEDHLLHPPASSSSTTCLKFALLHLGGRDGGGSLSGANSLAPSDDEGDDHHHHHDASASRVSSDEITTTLTTPTSLPLQSQSQSQSQEFENDGDDEMSGNPSDRYHKIRTHHHHHHYHHDQNHDHYHHHQRYPSSNLSQGEHRMANILGDGDSASNQSETHGQTGQQQESSASTQPGSSDWHDVEKEPSLDQQQQEDQSIQGSVY